MKVFKRLFLSPALMLASFAPHPGFAPVRNIKPFAAAEMGGIEGWPNNKPKPKLPWIQGMYALRHDELSKPVTWKIDPKASTEEIVKVLQAGFAELQGRADYWFDQLKIITTGELPPEREVDPHTGEAHTIPKEFQEYHESIRKEMQDRRDAENRYWERRERYEEGEGAFLD